MIEQQNKLIDALYEKSVISHSRKHSRNNRENTRF